jgi:hypothetical protein
MHHGRQNKFPIGFCYFFVLGILKIDWSFDSMPPSKFVFDVTWDTKPLGPLKFLVCHALLNRFCGSNLMYFKIS